MEPRDYVVGHINGEYAVLVNAENGGEVSIAMALLPPGTDIGTRLHYELFQYSISD